MGGTTRDVLIAGTEANSLYALDANTGAILWQRNFGPNFSDACPGGSGVRGTPVIDRTRGRIYLAPEGGSLYMVSLVNGADLAAPLSLITVPRNNKVRGGLNLVGNNLYVATGSGGCDRTGLADRRAR